ncbi:MAG: hypothetical protein EOM26_05950 [Alphaproteobacteria bacterium]|nr:hypothetical protein [Alphaproteobacteria bacterium]
MAHNRIAIGYDGGALEELPRLNVSPLSVDADPRAEARGLLAKGGFDFGSQPGVSYNPAAPSPSM